MAKQTKLSAQQQKLIEAAASRADGPATIPVKMSRSVATKLASSLETRKLLRPVRSTGDMPIWRKDAAGKSITLILTAAGRAAIGALGERTKPCGKKKTTALKAGGAVIGVNAPRAGSKQALVVEMLSEGQGATLDALARATGWLPHTTRAALTGLRKKGFDVARFSADGSGLSVYRLAAAITRSAQQ